MIQYQHPPFGREADKGGKGKIAHISPLWGISKALTELWMPEKGET